MADNTNVLFVVLDSVRARNLSLYGYHRETTPFLEELADDATVFQHAIAPTVWSLPSHISMFTGYHALEHGILDQSKRVDPEAIVFDELARQSDYSTGIFSQNAYLTAIETGINEAFDHTTGLKKDFFESGLQAVAMKTNETIGKNDPLTQREYIRKAIQSDAPIKSLLNGVYAKLLGWYPQIEEYSPVNAMPSDYTDAFESWVTDKSGSPWAACINYMGAHTDYAPAGHNYWGDDQLLKIQRDTDDIIWEFVGGNRPWWQREAMEHLYDGAIRNLDDEIRRLYQILEETGQRQDTLVIILGDHGELFGEPSDLHPVQLSAHAYSVHERLVHVPLLIDTPSDDGGSVVREPVSTVGIADVIRTADTNKTRIDPITEPPVITIAPGLELNQQDRARDYISDLDPYNQQARAVYEGDDLVTKHMTWGDASATMELQDIDQYHITSDQKAESVVNTAFGNFTDVDISAETDSEMSDIVEQQLKDLGYV